MRALKLLLVVGLLAIMSIGVTAQNGRPDLSEVYVTVQDFAVVRAGPSTLFERLAVLAPGDTLRATGRTFDGEWIQVAYTGELEAGATEDATVEGVTYGWVAYWLLVWSGDILELPVDGVPTVSYARRSGPRVTLQPGSYYYVDGVDPSTQVEGVFTEPTEVELTGRVGGPTGEEGEYFWIQFSYQGEFYWTASWEIGTPPRYFQLPDGSYVFPYGRLLLQLDQELRRQNQVWGIIASRWRNLDSGAEVTCNNIPADTSVREEFFASVDLSSEPIFEAAVRAVRDATGFINSALASFREVCAQPAEERFVTPEQVRLALIDIEEADRNLTLARTLLEPLERRNPLLGN